jgi:hypothetical protein
MDIIEPSTTEEKESLDTNHPSSDLTRDMNFISLKGYFNLDNPSVEEEEALNWIYKEFEKMGTFDMSEMLLNLKDVERRIGVQPPGTSRATAIRNYLKINSQISDLQGQREAMER